jgi:hypothetical protein
VELPGQVVAWSVGRFEPLSRPLTDPRSARDPRSTGGPSRPVRSRRTGVDARRHGENAAGFGMARSTMSTSCSATACASAPGAPPARTEAAIALPALSDRFPAARLGAPAAEPASCGSFVPKGHEKPAGPLRGDRAVGVRAVPDRAHPAHPAQWRHVPKHQDPQAPGHP